MSSNNVDERVVKMTFDNDQFEAGVKQTLTSLEELKESLKFNNSLTGIQAVSSAFNSFSLANITSQLETLTSRFSNLGIVGMTAIENITNKVINFTTSKMQSTLGQITSGGWARASSIAQSRFTLQGLLNDEEKVEQAFTSASNAVDGTAYSLNSAVAAASQLAASGVDVGEDMENTLKGIAGTAAMTGDSFDSIANIFTTVAGNGRLMGMQLTQLSAHGLNAASTIADYLGTTEAEVRDMTSKGKISFETFSAAMQDAFGEHAKDANKTFSGSMDNIKSALSRIGAIFSSGIIENDDLINALNNIRLTINSIKNAMMPLETSFKTLVSSASKLFSSVLGDVKFDSFEDFVDCVGKAMEYVASLMDRWTELNEKFKSSVLGIVAEETKEAAEDIYAATELVTAAWDIWNYNSYGTGAYRRAKLTEEFGEEQATIVQQLVNQIAAGNTDIAHYAINDLLEVEEAADEVSESMEGIGNSVKTVEPPIVPLVAIMKSLGHYANGFKTIWTNTITVLTKAVTSFKKIFSWKDLTQDIADYGDMFSNLAGYFTLTDERAEKLETILTGLWSAFDILRMVIKAVAGGLSKTLGPVLSVIFDAILTVAAEVGKIVTKFRDWYRENDLLKGILETLGTVISTVIDYVTTFFKKLDQLPAVQKIKDALKEFAELIGEKLLGYLGDAQEAVGNFFGSLDDAEDNPKMQKVLDSINGALENLISFSDDAKSNFNKFTSWLGEKAGLIDDTAGSAEDLSYKFQKVKSAMKSLTQDNDVAGFLDNIESVTGSFTEKVDNFISWIIKKFNSLDAAKLALIGFGASITTMGLSFSYLSWNLGNLAKSFTDIPTQISKTISSVKGVFKSMSEYIKNDSQAKLIKSYAIAIAVLAASLVALTFVDQDNLKQATISLGSLMGIMLVTVAIVGLVANKSKNFEAVNSVMRNMSIVFIAIATAAFILAEALMVLKEYDFTSDDWWKPVATLAAMMLSLVGIAAILSKMGGKMAAGAVSMILISASIWLIAKALLSLNNLDTTNIEAKVSALCNVLLALAVFFTIIKRLATGGGTINTFSVLAMIASIWLIELALIDIMYYGVTMDEIKQNLDKFYPVLIALGIIVAAVSLLGLACKGATKMGSTILAFAVTVLLMIFAIKKLSDIAQTGELGVGLIALTAIFIDLIVLMFALDKVAKVANGIGKELISIAIAVGILAVIAWALGKVDVAQFTKGIFLMSLVVAVAAVLAYTTQLMKEANYKALYAMVVAIGVITVAITILSFIPDKMSLLQATGILGLALVSLGVMMYMAGMYADQINVKTIITMVLAVALIASALYLLVDKANGDYKTLLSASLAMALVLVALGFLFLCLRQLFEKNTGVVASEPRIKMIAAVIAAVAVIAVSLSLLTAVIKKAGTEALGAAVISLLGVLAAIFIGISVLATRNLKFDSSMASMMILMIVTIAVVAIALAGLTAVVNATSADTLYTAVIGLISVIVAVGLVMVMISSWGATMSIPAVVAFGLSIGVLLAAAASLWLLLGTGADWQTMIGAAAAMVIVIASVSVAIGLLAALASTPIGLGVIVAVALVLSVAMLSLGASMLMAAKAINIIVKSLHGLTKVKFTVLEENMGTMLKLVGIFLLFSIVCSVFGAGLMIVGSGLSFVGAGLIVVGAGAALIVASLAALGVVIIAVANATTSFITALDNLINTFKTSKGDISSGISEIGTGLVNGITSFVSTLALKAPIIKTALIAIVKASIEIISEGLNTINDTILDGIIHFLSSLEEKLPTITEKTNNIIITILKFLASNASTYGYYGAVIAISFLYGLSQGLVEYAPQLGETIGNVVIALFEMVGSLIETLMPGITDLVYDGLLNMSEALWGLLAMSGNETAEEMYQTVLNEKASRSVSNRAKGWAKTAGESYSTEMDKQGASMSFATEEAVDKATDVDDVAEENAGSGANEYIDSFKKNISGSGDGIKSTFTNLLGGSGVDVTSIFSNGGSSSAFGFMDSFNGTIKTEHMDVSHLPVSAIEDMKEQGWQWEEVGKTMMRQVNEGATDYDFDLTDSYSDYMDELPDGEDGYDSGETIKEEWINGMTSATEEEKARIYHTYSTLANEADEGARDALDINSPSKKAMALRDSWVEGFVKIDSEIANQVSSAYGDLASESITAAANMMSSISQLVQDDSFDWTPTLSPVIDGTQLQNGSNLLTATFGNSALNLAADTALSVKDANANSLAEQVAYLSDQVKKLADTDYSEMLKGVNINVNSQTNVDGTPLRKMASSYTIQQIDEQQTSYNLSRGARA